LKKFSFLVGILCPSDLRIIAGVRHSVKSYQMLDTLLGGSQVTAMTTIACLHESQQREKKVPRAAHVESNSRAGSGKGSAEDKD
jgi:hypothetical protein